MPGPVVSTTADICRPGRLEGRWGGVKQARRMQYYISWVGGGGGGWGASGVMMSTRRSGPRAREECLF